MAVKLLAAFAADVAQVCREIARDVRSAAADLAFDVREAFGGTITPEQRKKRHG